MTDHHPDDYCDICGIYFGDTFDSVLTEHGTICGECYRDIYPEEDERSPSPEADAHSNFGLY